MSKQKLLKSKPAAAAMPRRSRGEFKNRIFHWGLAIDGKKIDEKSRYDFGQRGRILKTPKNREKKRKMS